MISCSEKYAMLIYCYFYCGGAHLCCFIIILSISFISVKDVLSLNLTVMLFAYLSAA